MIAQCSAILWLVNDDIYRYAAIFFCLFFCFCCVTCVIYTKTFAHYDRIMFAVLVKTTQLNEKDIRLSRRQFMHMQRMQTCILAIFNVSVICAGGSPMNSNTLVTWSRHTSISVYNHRVEYRSHCAECSARRAVVCWFSIRSSSL